ncbi:phosphatidylglycerophosphatase A [Halothiobacillus sp. DCM-1]|uniref:phosphatidylglycerophosphatase A family protein n=1 Tax=Halothiobacillus sp. DCM-1 TaxID=3112558 RepID=UPI00324DCB10
MSQDKNSPRANLSARVWRDPVLWLAFGFGTGLAPKAPGTFGTLPGIALLALIGALAESHSARWVAGLVVVLGLAGIWLCGAASRRLGVHDHGGIVWDEIVGVLIPFVWLPITPVNLLLGFVCFRLFDVLKPWPIRWVDQRVQGGLGIMLDDILAGLFALGLMALLLRFIPH